jgi:hypothetical protein
MIVIAARWADGQTDTMKLMVTFCNSAITPKKVLVKFVKS